MTAQIVVMNREAVALASDSAVTVTRGGTQKSFQSANKLFALSKVAPIGIMVFDAATILDVPWETIVKLYRDRLGTTSFDTVASYAGDFFSYLEEETPLLFPAEAQVQHARAAIYGYFYLIQQRITEAAKERLDEGELSEQDVAELVSSIIDEHAKQYRSAALSTGLPPTHARDAARAHRNIIREAKRQVLQELPLSATDSRRLTEIAGNLFARWPEGTRPDNTSNVVIAGFGNREIYPIHRLYSVEGVALDRIKYKLDDETVIAPPMSANISAFAQGDMARIFMEGIDAGYLQEEEQNLRGWMDGYASIVAEELTEGNDRKQRGIEARLRKTGRAIVAQRSIELRNYRQETFVDPVLDAVESLPKDELAAMAEALVNLTSFKRRVTLEAETVGGPVDVAVISKGDGFIWIKRKHYFRSELNPDFFARRQPRAQAPSEED